MPLGLRWGTISAVGERHDGLVRLEVDGRPCLAYPRLTGEVEIGDVVLVNMQATQLELGSGGFDVLYANLTRGLQLPVAERAHVMTLPYTPGQLAARFVEEDGAEGAERLAGRRWSASGFTASSRRSARRSPAAGSPTSSRAAARYRSLCPTPSGP